MFLTVISTTSFPPPDILLGPGDLCSHVILVERPHFDVHDFCHNHAPLMSGDISRFAPTDASCSTANPPTHFTAAHRGSLERHGLASERVFHDSENESPRLTCK